MSSKYPRYPAYKDSGVEWLGEVPEHWMVKPLKTPFTGDGALFKDGDWIQSVDISDNGVRYLTTGNVGEGVYKEQGSAYINDETFRKLSCTEVIPGDILVSRLNAPIGRACIVPDLGTRVVTSVDNVICRPVKDYFQKYIIYRFNSSDYWHELGLIASGATMQRIGRKELGNVRIAWPPLPEQQAIAAFLDTQTTRIDALIAEYKKLIALLKEKRQTLISHAVTKGLNPDVPMKDSGVEWLGMVPEYWEIKAIKWESIVQRGASPRPIDDPVYFDDQGEYSWVRISDVTASEVYLEETEQKLSELGADLSVKLEPGTLFLSIAGSVGKPCITQIKCCIHDGFVWFPTWRNSVKHLYYIFDSGQPYKGLGKMGTQLNLNTDTVGSIKVALPSLHEQQAIVAYLDNETAKMDALIQQAETGIDLLKERRTTLISDAVTGKIDVREIAAA